MRSPGKACALFWGAAAVLALSSAAAHGQGLANAAQQSTSNVGYIDSAIPVDMFRLRFDAGYDDNSPDRAEFFYSQYRQQLFIPLAAPTSGSGNRGGGPGGGPGPSSFVNGGKGATVTQKGGQSFIYSPQAAGLGAAETRIDYQDLSAYLELKVTDRLSGFVELPVRFLNPDVNPNTAGLADMNAGFKWAFWEADDQIATFQLRTYIPTGDSARGLGNNHVSLEPALLFYQRLTDRLTFEGEIRDWIPIGGTDFEGNILRYGTGVSYVAWQRDQLRLTPVVEVVGWTVLGGKATEPLGDGVFEIIDATGNTIVNLKAGARFWFGDQSDLYVGYGRALTGDFWYKDILRAEYRLKF